MRFPLARAASLVALLVLSAPSARAEEGYRHGRLRYVETGVSLQRATEVSAEEALVNQPFLPGDRVWTDAYGRAEFQFPDGTVVRLDSRSKMDYSGHEEDRPERIVLRLWSGSLMVRVRTRDAARFQIETPAGTVEALEQAMVRLDVSGGETRVSVYRGEAVLDDGRGRVQLAEGQRTYSRWGGEAEEAAAFDIREEDDFSRWDLERESQDRWAARSSEYLPRELDPYAGEFENNGNWRYESEVGYVWSPHVAAGWSPYSNGHWSWTPYGWTWIPYEPWGWAPSHYGRWGFSVSFGWYWSPGRVWGPGWVSWGVGHGYVGWCPLGWRDKPVYAWGGWGGHNRGYAVPRTGTYGSWMVLSDADFGQRDVARRRVPLTGLDPQLLRVADSPNLRPTRDARALLATNPVARPISRRPERGDFVRELSADGATTVPAPWMRRPRAGGGEAASRGARDSAVGARPRGDGGREAASTGRTAAPSATADSQERLAARPRGSSSLPWFAPREQDQGATAERPQADRAQADRGTAARREPSRSRGGDSPRPEVDAAAAAGAAAARSRRQERESSYRREPQPETPREAPRERSQPRESYRSRDDGGRSRSDGSGSRPPREQGGGAARAASPPRDGAQARGGGESRGSSESRGGGESNGGGESRGGGQSRGGGHSASRPPRSH